MPRSFMWSLWRTGLYWGRSSLAVIIHPTYDTHLWTRSGTTGRSTKGLNLMSLLWKEGKDGTWALYPVTGLSHCSWSATGISRGGGRHCKRMAGTWRTSWLQSWSVLVSDCYGLVEGLDRLCNLQGEHDSLLKLLFPKLLAWRIVWKVVLNRTGCLWTNIEALVVASKDSGLEVNAEKTK